MEIALHGVEQISNLGEALVCEGGDCFYFSQYDHA